MPPNLEGLPNENFDQIIRLLAFDDICNLRQVSRAVATNTRHQFKPYFYTKHVSITRDSLQAFVDVTQPGWLGCYIQQLIVVGFIYENSGLESRARIDKADIKKQQPTVFQQDFEIVQQRRADFDLLHGSGTDVSLLSKAFQNIVANSDAGKLLSLSLEVKPDRRALLHLKPFIRVVQSGSTTLTGPLLRDEDSGIRFAQCSERLLGQSIATTFHTTIRSLATSNLPIEKLQLFNDHQHQTYAIASNELGKVDFEGVRTSLTPLKSLSLNFTDRRIDTESHIQPRDDNDLITEAAKESNFTGLRSFLQLSKHLEALKVDRNSYHPSKLTDDLHKPHCEKFFRYAAEMETPPQLKRIELHNIVIEEESLLTFLRRTRVHKLFLSRVRLTSGTFRLIFDYCTSDATDVEELHLKHLSELRCDLLFNMPLKTAYIEGHNRKLVRIGSEVKQSISYVTVGPRRLGSRRRVQ